MSEILPECRYTPNPGSDAAIEHGCICPVLDNHRGNRPDNQYWIREGCPVHDPGGIPLESTERAENRPRGAGEGDGMEGRE